MDARSALRTTYARAEAVLADVDPSQYRLPTPCTEWDVRTLMNHMVAVLEGFAVVLAGAKPDWAAPVLGEAPVGDFRRAAARNLLAWAEPGAAERPSPKLPGMRLIDVNLLDTLTHTWDLATAAGHPADLDPAVVAFVHERWRAAPLESSRAARAFGPEIAVPLDAPALERLLGLLGRPAGGSPLTMASEQ